MRKLEQCFNIVLSPPRVFVGLFRERECTAVAAMNNAASDCDISSRPCLKSVFVFCLIVKNPLPVIVLTNCCVDLIIVF